MAGGLPGSLIDRLSSHSFASSLHRGGELSHDGSPNLLQLLLVFVLVEIARRSALRNRVLLLVLSQSQRGRACRTLDRHTQAEDRLGVSVLVNFPGNSSNNSWCSKQLSFPPLAAHVIMALYAGQSHLAR